MNRPRLAYPPRAQAPFEETSKAGDAVTAFLTKLRMGHWVTVTLEQRKMASS